MKQFIVGCLKCVICVEYALYGWGPSIVGIGQGFRSKDKMIPHPIVGFDSKVRSIAVGNDHCAAITGINILLLLVLEEGKLFTWGKNGCYECGLGHGEDVIVVLLIDI